MCVSKMCVCKMWCVCKKFVSKMLGSFQDLLVKMLAFIGIVMGMFFMGNAVSDPSSVIDALKAFNTTSTPPTCDANQVAHHYKNLAFDVTFLSIAMALAACVVCIVKIIVDAGAQDQEEEQGDHVAAAQADADRKLADAAYAAASDVAVAAVQAEAAPSAPSGRRRPTSTTLSRSTRRPDPMPIKQMTLSDPPMRTWRKPRPTLPTTPLPRRRKLRTRKWLPARRLRRQVGPRTQLPRPSRISTSSPSNSRKQKTMPPRRKLRLARPRNPRRMQRRPPTPPNPRLVWPVSLVGKG